MSYQAGDTLTLPSPTHVHHVDLSSSLRSLRRSLSRSPSKFRLVTKSPSPTLPLSPCPRSPPRRPQSNSGTVFSGSPINPPHTPSPLAIPFSPSLKLALRSSSRSKAVAPRPSPRSRTSPRSPMKRVLSQTSDSGNAPPTPTRGSSSGQENQNTSPVERKSSERNLKMQNNPDAPVNYALSRLGGDGSNDSHPVASTSSPLKRSDAIMNLDQASLGSPVAKRRSLHGSASFGHDFNVFDHGPSSPHFEIHDDSTPEYELSTTALHSEAPASITSMPRRSSSLRKSTLQQRHGEKTSWGRRQAAQVLAAQQLANNPEMASPNLNKNRPRLSLDQFMPPMQRDSPFNSQGGLPNASVHLVTHPHHQPHHQPHPLSRTMTNSSSNSSLPEDSPTHVPLHHEEKRPRPKMDFSKSLPAGSLRPFNLEEPAEESGSFSTPSNYKSEKPHPAAFMSTGLISKVKRHPEDNSKARGLGIANIPDTPCKKQVNGFGTYPQGMPGSAIAKARHVRHSFGTPSTPFQFNNSHQPAPGTFGKGASIFGSSFGHNSLTRRGSFLSADGSESGGSPDPKGEGQNSADFELPPTPTKQALVSSFPYQLFNSGSPSNHRSLPASTSAVGYKLTNRLPRTSSKLSLSASPGDQDEEDSDGSMEMNDSPTTALCRPSVKASHTTPSFGRSRALRSPNAHTPTPLMPKSLTTPFLSPSRKPGFAKISHVAPASPLERIDFFEKMSPRTPQDSMLPPDPSGLSISNPRDGHLAKSGAAGRSMPPPATPTAGRDYFASIGDRRLSTTPISTSFVPQEIDDSLTSRFEKVELIGTGEFSNVYRVTRPTSAPNFTFGASTTPPTPIPQQVFAVKKSRQPFQGIRDRQRKLQEVNVLRALGHSDHVVHLIDSWEEKNHLYIQTEFCEEGSLDLFLAENGRKGRLDDFRIWKILLELCQGLRHVHDSGFIHLDLKPANILITFEGILKVADFGMAAHWPVENTIEGEGDREYMSPESLLGRFDKPADVFSLGLIMLEIAANVQLPDNGPTWRRLRSGDMSDVPSLTSSLGSSVQRDVTGIPVGDSELTMDSFCSDEEIEAEFGSPTMATRKRHFNHSIRSLSHNPGNLFGSMRRGELPTAPSFMQDITHDHALDKIVRWMISPEPEDRPAIHQVLQSDGLRWVQARRRAGATVFEGNWGPADDVLSDDAEMMDV